jgi:hypothetical protein
MIVEIAQLYLLCDPLSLSSVFNFLDSAMLLHIHTHLHILLT